MIVSEYAPGVEPMKHHFLARNRIIAGLSRGVVVVQAGARSGSLVTANFAADYGRDVFVVSNSESQEERLGGEKLIDQGAIAIRSARDVLREYNLLPSDSEQVEDGEWLTMTVDSFLAITELSAGMLLKLELEGRVARVSGNRIMVSPSLISE
jgi:DNA processing protein